MCFQALVDFQALADKVRLSQALQREQAAANERAIRTERKLDRTEKKLEATQAELAKVKVAASEAQSFSRQSALCQMRALYEKYRFFYYSKTVDAYRGGFPASLEDADNRWQEYMAGASPEEVCTGLTIHSFLFLPQHDLYCASNVGAPITAVKLPPY